MGKCGARLSWHYSLITSGWRQPSLLPSSTQTTSLPSTSTPSITTARQRLDPNGQTLHTGMRYHMCLVCPWLEQQTSSLATFPKMMLCLALWWWHTGPTLPRPGESEYAKYNFYFSFFLSFCLNSLIIVITLFFEITLKLILKSFISWHRKLGLDDMAKDRKIIVTFFSVSFNIDVYHDIHFIQLIGREIPHVC